MYYHTVPHEPKHYSENFARYISVSARCNRGDRTYESHPTHQNERSLTLTAITWSATAKGLVAEEAQPVFSAVAALTAGSGDPSRRVQYMGPHATYVRTIVFG